MVISINQIENLTKGTSVKMGMLDPIGYDLIPGPELYFDLMKKAKLMLRIFHGINILLVIRV